MNRNFEKPRMSVKSNRSIMSNQPKRAGKTISCIRNGKSTKTSRTLKENDAFALKQEPEDSYYNESSYYDQQDQSSFATTENRHRSQPTVPGQTRVRSHARSLRAMANPSAVWSYFELCQNDQLRAQCKVCKAVVVRGGANPRQCGTTNLHRHLRVHHKGKLVDKTRYELGDNGSKEGEGNSQESNKPLKISPDNIVKKMRRIAPAPPNLSAQAQVQKVMQEQRYRGQSSKTEKTLLLKPIPIAKLNEVNLNSQKNSSQPVRHSLQTFRQLPQAVLPQQPTEVCLRWNSYLPNMQASFPSLLEDEQFVDVTLACEGQSIKCHKMILSSCSDYLAKLLRENPCQHPIILMRDLKFWEVEALVKFMYRGEVNVTHDKLPQLINAAEALQVKGLAGPSNPQPRPPPLLPKPKASSTPLSHQTNTIPQPKAKASKSVANSVPAKCPSLKKFSVTSKLAPIDPPQVYSAKRGIKRQAGPIDTPEMRPFTKIRLQRPVTPSNSIQAQNSESNARGNSKIGQNSNENLIDTSAVKEEPIDYPLSPGDHLYQTDSHDEESSKDDTTFESMMMKMQQEENTNGDNIELADSGPDHENHGRLDNNDDNNDDDIEDDEDEDDEDTEQMEVVPTDFLEQEQNIVEDSEDQMNRSSESYDGNEYNDQENNDDEEYEDEQEDEEEGSEKSASSVTKKDKELALKKIDKSKIERVKDKEKT